MNLAVRDEETYDSDSTAIDLDMNLAVQDEESYYLNSTDIAVDMNLTVQIVTFSSTK